MDDSGRYEFSIPVRRNGGLPSARSSFVEQYAKGFQISLEVCPPCDEYKTGLDDILEGVSALNDRVLSLTDLPIPYVFVTCGALGKGEEGTLNTAVGLQEKGFTPVVHVTCKYKGREEIAEYLDSLLSEGISHLLVIRGDKSEGESRLYIPEEGFQHASDLIEFVHGYDSRFVVAGAAHPDGHPEAVSRNDDFRYSFHKFMGADHFVSQFTLYPNNFGDLFLKVNRLRNRNGMFPVTMIPSLIPVSSAKKIEKLSPVCGFKAPDDVAGYLRTNPVGEGCDSFADFQTRLYQVYERCCSGVHIYTRNFFKSSVRYLRSVEEAKYRSERKVRSSEGLSRVC
ncbi:hypothetical protein CMO92_04510 [Candidatus Woesearchaeota archaeon]|nr:hypothetical protein [Candidatus Woesearchaeota archaeon]|tara:strand:+ start:1523 stop:2539 length:1017 start_codon:yes stop_codon:yes gene_type:complete